MRRFWLIVYYGLARKLPKSTIPLLGKIGYKLRYQCAKHLFAECGEQVNVEQGAYIGNGRQFRVGNHVGIGKDFCSHNRPLTIQDGLLMGENVLFLGGGALIRRPEHTYRFCTRNRFADTIRDMWRCVDRCAGHRIAGV